MRYVPDVAVLVLVSVCGSSWGSLRNSCTRNKKRTKETRKVLAVVLLLSHVWPCGLEFFAVPPGSWQSITNPTLFTYSETYLQKFFSSAPRSSRLRLMWFSTRYTHTRRFLEIPVLSLLQATRRWQTSRFKNSCCVAYFLLLLPASSCFEFA